MSEITHSLIILADVTIDISLARLVHGTSTNLNLAWLSYQKGYVNRTLGCPKFVTLASRTRKICSKTILALSCLRNHSLINLVWPVANALPILSVNSHLWFYLLLVLRSDLAWEAKTLSLDHYSTLSFDFPMLAKVISASILLALKTIVCSLSNSIFHTPCCNKLHHLWYNKHSTEQFITMYSWLIQKFPFICLGFDLAEEPN